MILNQKWALEVETVSSHTCVDEPFEDIVVSTYYYTVPLVSRCKFLEYDVKYFRVINDTIYLCITDFEEV